MNARSMENAAPNEARIDILHTTLLDNENNKETAPIMKGINQIATLSPSSSEW